MTRWTAGFAVALAAAFPLAQPASASHACAGIAKGGTIGPPLVVGEECEESSGHLCRATELGVHPTLMFVVYACVPR